MKEKLTVIIFIAAIYFLGMLAGNWINELGIAPNIGVKNIETVPERPLDKYTINTLSQTKAPPGNFEITEEINNEGTHLINHFVFEFSPDLTDQNLKKTTGQINIPAGEGPFPIVVMFRGYIDQEIYRTGTGTRNAAQVFAQNGFITVAPDFLGYGASDPQDTDAMKARFETYTTALSLLNSLNQIESWDKQNVSIWGHSNGGQIALTVLEITSDKIPTTLWAPVSKPFPYSVLYYTDESEDRGKFLRAAIADFEENYNPDLYSLDLYLGNIKAPLQIHQGTLDDSVPIDWSNQLAEKLEEEGNDFEYFIYQGADHNMRPSWNTVVNRDLAFFRSYLR